MKKHDLATIYTASFIKLMSTNAQNKYVFYTLIPKWTNSTNYPEIFSTDRRPVNKIFLCLCS